MNIIEALEHPHALGGFPCFRDLTMWRPWLAFLRALYGLPMDAANLELFRRFTGRQEPHAEGYPEAAVITGRQSGKTRIAGTLASFEALTGDERGTHAVLVAQDARSATRALMSYARDAFEAPALRCELVKDTAELLELRNGINLSVYPCRPAAVRGIRARIVVADELGFFTATDGRPTDTEMLRAVRPTLATTGGKLLVLSSPYGQSGALWDLHRKHYSVEDSPVLVWQASAPDMNPTLPADYLERMAEDDPVAYRSEVLGEFRAGTSTFIDSDALDASVAHGRRELAPAGGIRYRAFVDPSGGRSDAFTLAVGHRDGERAVIDAVRAWASPFNPTSVVGEAAELLKAYRIGTVVGDRYGGEWPREAFRSRGIRYEPAREDRSQLYLGLLPAINSGAVELPDLPELLRELRGLERRRGGAGRDRIDHRPGSHDDRANAVAGVASLLRRKPGSPIVIGDRNAERKPRAGFEELDPAALVNKAYERDPERWT